VIVAGRAIISPMAVKILVAQTGLEPREYSSWMAPPIQATKSGYTYSSFTVVHSLSKMLN
jgi:hypothetical protein